MKILAWRDKWEQLPTWGLVLAMVGFFFARNWLAPLIADDYSYAFIWDGADGGNISDNIGQRHRVQSIGDIVLSQYEHYFTWGGRTFAHTLVQIFVLLGKNIFDIANTVCLAALIWLIYWLGTQEKKLNKNYILGIFFGLWFCAPFLWGTTFWLTGACNYLWMSMFQCLFLVPYARSYLRCGESDGVWPLFPLLVLGLLTGWSNEGGGAATLLLLIFFSASLWRQRRLSKSLAMGLAAFTLGYAFLLLAPGNIARLMQTEPNFHYTMGTLAHNMEEGFWPVLRGELLLMAPLIVYFGQHRGQKFSARDAYITAFAIASISVLIVMMLAPQFPERAGYASTIFLLVANVAAWRDMWPSTSKTFKQVIMFVCPVALGCLLLSMAASLYVDISIHRQIERRFDLVYEQRAQAYITVPQLHESHRLKHFLKARVIDYYFLYWCEMKNDIHNNRNILFSQYYGLPPIIAIANN